MRTDKTLLPFFVLTIIWFYIPVSLRAQAFAANDTLHQIILSGNQRFPSISKDGRIVFQSDKSGDENIFLFNPAADSIVNLTTGSLSEQHPVWVPGKEALVYDKDYGNGSRLFYLDLRTGKTRFLLHRKISSREASFTPSRHLVVFSGFDDRTQHWQIFSYDFVYDNLNRLTDENGNCSFPVFSPDGRTIAYTFRSGSTPAMLKTINWYGEEMKTIVTNIQGRACWTPDSWRLLYVSKAGNHYIISSIRNDGTHKTELYSSLQPLCCPVLSANGKELIFSMKSKNRFQLRNFIRKKPE